MLRYAWRLTANGAEAADLVHTVVARLLAKRSAIEVPDNVPGWLRTVLFRAFIDDRRRMNRKLLAEQSLLHHQATAAFDRAMSGVDVPAPTCAVSLEEVHAIIASLPLHYREAYELYTFHHLSYEDIAARLDVPTKTVGSRLNRARSRLRALVAAKQRGRLEGSHAAR